MAGCILIDFEKMQVINRSPAYRNQYVHRRDSVSLAMLSEAEIKERVQLGLIEGYHEEEEEEDGEFVEEEWEEFDEDEMNTSREDNDSSLDDNQYVVDDRRKSSVEPSRTIASPPGSTHSRDYTLEDNEMPVTRINFSDVATSTRKKQAEFRFGAISEENGEDDDDEGEESTVDGEEEDNMEPFDDNEHESSTSMSPSLKKFTL